MQFFVGVMMVGIIICFAGLGLLMFGDGSDSYRNSTIVLCVVGGVLAVFVGPYIGYKQAEKDIKEVENENTSNLGR